FRKRPGGVVRRSFIRAYAQYLGLDEERILAEYLLAARPDTDVDLHRMAARRLAFYQPHYRTPLIAFLVAAALLSGGYALFRHSRRAAEMQVNSPSAQGVKANPKPTTSPNSGGVAQPPGSGLSAATNASPTGQTSSS